MNKDIEILYDKGYEAFSKQNDKEAITHLEAVIDSDPSYINAYRPLAISLYRQKQSGKAEEICRRAIAISDKTPAIHSFLAIILKEKGDFEEAKALLKHAISLQPNKTGFYVNLSAIYDENQEFGKAEEYCRKAVSVGPDNAAANYNLGFFLYQRGDKDEAKSYFEKAIVLNPKNAMAHRMLSTIVKYKDVSDPYINQISALIEDETRPFAKAQFNFILGKIYEDLEDYKSSFSFYKAGNDEIFKVAGYSSEENLAFFQQFKEKFDLKFCNTHKNAISDDGKGLIFIIGMPRSGTTLVEQIISSHSHVRTGGELTDISLLYEKYSKIDTPTESDLKSLANEYLMRTERFRGDAQFFIDKMPTNFFYVGFIKLLFPGAKIIHCNRDPVACCFSLYKTVFPAGLHYSYNLGALGEYYSRYLDLMKHWEKVLPDHCFNIEYKSLVEAPEENIEKLLSWCELPWEENCLSFHENKSVVNTASALQVKEPIYKTALTHWKNYEPYLGPLIKILNKG